MVSNLRLIYSIVMKISIMLDSGVVTLLADVEQMKFQIPAGTLVKLCDFATHIYQECVDEK